MPSLPFTKKSAKKRKESEGSQNTGTLTQPTAEHMEGTYIPPGFEWVVVNGRIRFVRTNPEKQGRELCKNPADNDEHSPHSPSSDGSYNRFSVESHGVGGPKSLENIEDPMAIFLHAHERFQERLSKQEAEAHRFREERDKLQDHVNLLNKTIDELGEDIHMLKLSLNKKKEEDEAILDASMKATNAFMEEIQRIHSRTSSMESSNQGGS